jgi:oxygen-dependent protoporphyrinogen oxidase
MDDGEVARPAPDDAVLLRMFVRDDGEWTSLPDEALVAAARADAERTLRIGGEPLFVRVGRHQGSMPRYTVGHLGRVAAIEAAVAGWPAVTLAGASYRGVGLPDCVSQGLSAAAAVRSRLAGGAAVGEPDVAAVTVAVA